MGGGGGILTVGKGTQVPQFILEAREIAVMVIMGGGGGDTDSWQERSGSSVHPGGERDSCDGDHGWGGGGGGILTVGKSAQVPQFILEVREIAVMVIMAWGGGGGILTVGKSAQVPQFILEVREIAVMVIMGGGGGGGNTDGWQECSGSSVHPGGERDSCDGDHGWGGGGGY